MATGRAAAGRADLPVAPRGCAGEASVERALPAVDERPGGGWR
jgi:hypothetical protein